jgi:AAA domain/RepB DNA-primase from phage plasmid
VADLTRTMDAEDFLELIWGSTPAWIDLPTKVDNYWISWHYRYAGVTDDMITGRIDDALRDNENLYFSCGTFAERGRKAEDMNDSSWLWADLDEIHPTTATKIGLFPTVAWESSPSRYQAMWRLEKKVSGKAFDKVNRALSYFLGADVGGWDRTQVLRLPGSRNFKYEDAPIVKYLWYQPEVEYGAKYVWDIVKEASPLGDGLERGSIVLPRRAMPVRVKHLLGKSAGEVVEGERSTVLWSLECGLAEAGWNEEEIFKVLWDSVWNKWREVGTGDERLKGEIRKAIHHVLRKAVLRENGTGGSKTTASSGRKGSGDRDRTNGRSASDVGGETGAEGSEKTGASEDGSGVLVLPWTDYWSFMGSTMADPKWMIKGIWTAGSQGILGGEPKTSKTTIALGIAMSVASGKPLFGDEEYPVRDMGPVLFVQEENASWLMQDRMKKMAKRLGLIGGEVKFRKSEDGSLGGETAIIEFPTDIPLTLLNNYGFDLTREEHRDALLRECEKIQPRLVVLDPLYMVMAGVNFNNAHDLAPYLKWILKLSNDFKCSVILVHHFRKMQSGAQDITTVRPGQRLMGNSTLHGFVDSGLYVEQGLAKGAGSSTMSTRMYREFRSAEPQKPLDLTFAIGPPGSLEFNVDFDTEDLKRAIRDIVRKKSGITARQLELTTGIEKGVILDYCTRSKYIKVDTRNRGYGVQYTLRWVGNGRV